jgi:hypothetical protein
MLLTKTDFIQFLQCPNALWLQKHKPEVYAEYKGDFSLFLEKLVREGYEVEAYACALFPDIVDLGHVAPQHINDHLQKGVYSQVSLETESGLFARLDVVRVRDDGVLDIYEVKSSTSVKTDKAHNHLKDICFQAYVAEQCGYTVGDVYHVHLNKAYRKRGDIDPQALLEVTQVNGEVAKIAERTQEEIRAALAYIAQESITETQCPCIEKTKSNHCDTFRYFNRNVPEHAIFDLQRISEAKIHTLHDAGVESIVDVPESTELSPYQVLQRRAVQSGKPVVDREKIREILEALQYPLYFFDYETLPFAVPRLDGYGPHQHIPMQYSVHVLQKDGSLDHYEYLAERLEAPRVLLETMQQHVSKEGNMVSWYASFEKTRNTEMAVLYPEYRVFLEDVNERTFDLMDIFTTHYIDARFHGSASIKAVLPVLVPDLSYKVLAVQNGTMAVDSLERLYTTTDTAEIQEIRTALLEYCKLDTVAMVEIFNVLQEL